MEIRIIEVLLYIDTYVHTYVCTYIGIYILHTHREHLVTHALRNFID